jgi:VanZ family protein
VSRASSALARHLAVAYLVLIVYASLHPFTGWSEPAAPLLAYLSGDWPRYYTAFDVIINALAYLPLGFLLVPALLPRFTLWPAACTAVVAAASLSFSLETLQNFLPNRVPSNVDLGANTLGGLLGATLGLRWGRLLSDGGRLHLLRNRLFVAGKASDLGLVLLAAWLLTQLNPEVLLFGTGDLRSLLGLPAPLPYTVGRFFAVEFGVAAAAAVATGLIAATLVRGGRLWPIALVLLAALMIKALASALLVTPGQFGYWITRGNMAGVACGAGLVLAASRLSVLTQRIIAAIALLFATALVNLAPENPYIAASVAVWQPSHFLNFNGLTRLVSSLWPFAALSYLMVGSGKQ